MLLEKLCQIGFSPAEAKVYLELLKIGSQPASIIAKRTGLNRTTTYSILRSLVRKGVVSSCMKESVKLFTASDPNALVGFVDRQCRTYDCFRDEILSMVPEFRSLSCVYDFKRPIVSFFDGVEGVKQLAYDILSAGDDFLTYFAVQKWLKIGQEKFLSSLREARELDKQLNMRAIVPDLPEVKDFFHKYYGSTNGDSKTELLYFADQNSMFSNDINIYDNKVSILHLEKGAEYGVLIESKEVSAMHRGIFEIAWKGFKVNK